MRVRAMVVGAATGALLVTGGIPTTAAGAGGRSPEWTSVLQVDPETEVQQEVLALINSERAEHGCPKVHLNDRLIEAARDHAAEMAGYGYFAHHSLDGDDAGERVRDAGYRWNGYAENIARGQDSPREVVRDWMDSRPHRENILDCDLREVGVGLAFDSDHEPYWVQDLAAPRRTG